MYSTVLLMTYAQGNILIDRNKNAVLCDFGLASITTDAESAHASTVGIAGSIRWMAPERLSIFDGDPESVPTTVRVTKESDMYSLAMVVIEVRTPPTMTHDQSHTRTPVSGLDIHRASSVLGHSGCSSDTRAWSTEASNEASRGYSPRFDCSDLGNRRDMLEDPAIRATHGCSGS